MGWTWSYEDGRVDYKLVQREIDKLLTFETKSFDYKLLKSCMRGSKYYALQTITDKKYGGCKTNIVMCFTSIDNRDWSWGYKDIPVDSVEGFPPSLVRLYEQRGAEK